MPRQTIGLVRTLFSFCFLLLLFFSNSSWAVNQWQNVAPGIDYLDLKVSSFTPWSHVHVFLIDLKENVVSLITAKDLGRQHAPIEDYAQFSKALLAINGGFFDQNYHPLGLRIDNNHEQNPLKKISWWGIFYIKNQKPYLTTIFQYNPNLLPEFAIQSGPRLLINNLIPPLKPGRAERSALGIRADGRIIILVTDNTPLSTTELAQLMKAQPLHCENALNLDGGSSSQLRAQFRSFQLNVSGFSNLSDAVIVKSRV